MLRLCTEIQLGDYVFDYANEVMITSSWKNLTDTCTIKLPRNIITKDGMRIDDKLQVGNKVAVKIGYDLAPTQRFVGYIEQIGAATAVLDISCQDEMWKLKQISFSKSWSNATAKEVVDFVKQKMNATWEVEYLGDVITLGQFKIENQSGAKVLQKLKDYGVVSFFRKGKLIVGKPYETDSTKLKKIRLEYGKNVISWKNLTYKRKDDVKLKVKVIINYADGKNKNLEIGDTEGEERTLNFYNLPEAEAKKQAEALLEKMKYDGYRGTLELFGEPEVNNGDAVELIDWRYPERNGLFYIDQVVTTKKVASIRQEITLGSKL